MIDDVPLPGQSNTIDDFGRQALKGAEMPWYDASGDHFRPQPPPTDSIFWKKLVQWLEGLEKWLPDLSGWLPSNPFVGVDAPSTSWIKTLIIALIIALLVIIVINLLLAIRQAHLTDANQKRTGRASSEFDFNLESDLLDQKVPADEIWVLAEKSARDRKWRKAVELAWVAILKQLIVLHELENLKSLTPRQWSILANRLAPEMQFNKIVPLYERVIFGERTPDIVSFNRWWARAESIYRQLAQAEKSA